MRENGKNWKANEQATLGTGVIKLRQESERKALPLWTHNTLQALITDMDKQMSAYHSQHVGFILTGDRKNPFQVNNSSKSCWICRRCKQEEKSILGEVCVIRSVGRWDHLLWHIFRHIWVQSQFPITWCRSNVLACSTSEIRYRSCELQRGIPEQGLLQTKSSCVWMLESR